MKCPNYGCEGHLAYEETRSLLVDMEIGEVDVSDPDPPEISITCEYCGDVTSHFYIQQDGPIIRLTYSPPRALSI